jgi:hypothetical protein
MKSIGIDVHKVNSHICVVGENAGVLEERRIHTDRERFATVLGKRPKARVLIEASTASEWVARYLEELGHQVIGTSDLAHGRVSPSIEVRWSSAQKKEGAGPPDQPSRLWRRASSTVWQSRRRIA